MSNGSKILFTYALIATLVIVFLQICTPKHFVPNPPDRAQIVKDSLFNLRADSIKVGLTKDTVLEKVRVETVVKYKYIRQEVIKNIHDTVSVLKFIAVADSLINNDTLQIQNLRTVNGQLTTQLTSKTEDEKKQRARADSLEVLGKSYGKGFKHGFLTGALVGGVVVMTPQVVQMFKK